MDSNIKEKKKVNLKISKMFLLIGLVVIILGVVFLSKSIIEFNHNKEQYNIEKEQKEQEYQAEVEEYERAYDEWYDAWMNHTANLNDQPEMPTRDFEDLFSFPKIPIMLPISIIIIVGGVVVLGVGLKPYITKFVLKHKKETLDYAGEDMTNIGNTMVDIGAPVINKAMDSVVVPTVSKIKGAVGDTPKQTNDQTYCKYCGELIDGDSKFCNKCGKEQ